MVNILNRHIQKTMQFLTETAWFLIVRKMSGKTVCSANPEIMVLFGLSKKFTFGFIDFKQKIGYSIKKSVLAVYLV